MEENKHTWKRNSLRWCAAFLIPFVITFVLLVHREKNKAYDDLQRNSVAGQVMGKPSDDLEAWKMATVFTSCLAAPCGFIGMSGYGGFLLFKKLVGSSKKDF